MNDKLVNFNKSVELDKVLIPYILKEFNVNGDIQSQEGTEDDKEKGIDFTVTIGKNIHTFATRIRNYTTDGGIYSDFTIREQLYANIPAEYEKRTRDIFLNNEDNYPKFTLQAWVDKTTHKFIRGSIILTKDLYKFMGDYPSYVERRRNKAENDGRYFLCVNWNKIQEKNDFLSNKGELTYKLMIKEEE